MAALTVLIAVGACAGGGAPSTEGPAAPPRTLPALEAGTPSPSAEAAVARLLPEARESLAAGRLEAAERAAARVVSEHPEVRGSSEALWIRARVAWRQGASGRASELARRFADLLPSGDPLIPAVRLLQGRALSEEGEHAGAVEVFLRVSGDAADSLRAEALDGIRASVREVAMGALESLAQDPPPGWERLRAPVLAEYALALHARRRDDQAARAARSALELAEEGPEVELARSVLADDVTVERRRTALLGSLLPVTGSPGQQEYAGLVREGIEVRLAVEREIDELPLELEILDDEGQPQEAAEFTRELISRGAAAVIGPLGEAALEASARARPEPVPMISPTARMLPDGQEAVYSLAGPDPKALQALARYAADRMLADAVVLHPRTRSFDFQAEAFAREFERLGGRVRQTLTYPPGATFFREQMQAVRELQPAALVLPLPASDIELLAPQITYFGLDTLGIQVLGTAEWAESSTLNAVEPRHTDGVVVATPRTPGRPTEAYERFVEDYETTLQKTLRSRIPALGYDAVGLLIEALRSGAREAESVRRALEEIQDFEGATGTLSVSEGRIVRVHRLVRLRNREMIPIRVDIEEGKERP